MSTIKQPRLEAHFNVDNFITCRICFDAVYNFIIETLSTF